MRHRNLLRDLAESRYSGEYAALYRISTWEQAGSLGGSERMMCGMKYLRHTYHKCRFKSQNELCRYNINYLKTPAAALTYINLDGINAAVRPTINAGK